MYGGFYQMAARLINRGIADRELFAPITITSPMVWKKLGPLAYAWRERYPSNPRWADLEYLIFGAVGKPPFDPNRYNAAFRTRIQLDRALGAWQLEVRDALLRAVRP